MNEKYNNMIVVHSMNYFSLFVSSSSRCASLLLISVIFLVHFNIRKKPILYLREDERMEEFRFIDNGIHFFLSDQSSWLDVFVCLETMNIITWSETKWHLCNKIYDDLFCQWRMEKTKWWNNVYFKMYFWLVLKDKSEKIHDYSTV